MPQQGIAQVVRQLPTWDDPNLLVGADNFSDAGVYKLRADLAMVQSLDFFPPLVDDPYVFGQIAAANALSDVFALGAQPLTAMNISCFPDDELDLSILSEILNGGAERVKMAGAVVVGGHSVRDKEIKFGLSVTGVVDPARMLGNDRAQPGDVLLLTKPLGTGFVTTAFKRQKCPDAVLADAVASMIQLNSVGRRVALECGAHATTDITGFGLGGHAYEMAQASGVTIALDVSMLPTLPGAAELAAAGHMTRASKSNRDYLEPHLRIEGSPDKQALEFVFDAQTSGGLLISLPAQQAEAAREAARSFEARAAVIVGEVLPKQDASLVLRP